MSKHTNIFDAGGTYYRGDFAKVAAVRLISRFKLSHALAVNFPSASRPRNPVAIFALMTAAAWLSSLNCSRSHFALCAGVKPLVGSSGSSVSSSMDSSFKGCSISASAAVTAWTCLRSASVIAKIFLCEQAQGDERRDADLSISQHTLEVEMASSRRSHPLRY